MGVLPAPDVARMRAESTEVLTVARERALQAVVAERPGAVRDLVSVEQRIAALHGLDAPRAAEVTHTGSVSLEALFERVSAPVLPVGVVVDAEVVDDD